MPRLIVFDSRLGAREGDDGQKLLASYPPEASAASTRAVVGLAGGLIAYGAAWEGIGGGDDDDDETNENDKAEEEDDQSSLSAVRPLERGFAVHLERSRWVMHRASPGVWWLLVRQTEEMEREKRIEFAAILSATHGERRKKTKKITQQKNR